MLVEQGHEVTGVTMQLWPSGDSEGGCCSVDAARDARRVCDLLGIDHYTLNFREVFEREVIDYFCSEYARGRTPNPCIACNARLKFADLLARALAQGCDFLATGHYARIVKNDEGAPWLARGADRVKDQSYFLYRLTRRQMEHVLFPLGGLRKSEVRDIARRHGLPTAAKRESQDTCFASARDHAAIVAARFPQACVPGPILDRTGDTIGQHRGVARYTIGQRSGLGISSRRGPWYVAALDVETNRIVVGRRDDVRATQVTSRDFVWHGDLSGRCEALVRYRMSPAPARFKVSADELVVVFDESVGAVAPGQSVVCYRGDVVAGGGVIECAA